MSTEILLVRHGQVAGSPGGASVSGSENPPLSDRGRDSARRVAERLSHETGITALYASPLRRAQETADIISACLNIEPETVEDFREWDFMREMSQRDRLQLLVVTTLSHVGLFRRLLSYQWAHSPSLKSFVSTVSAALERVVDAHPNERVVIVAHGGTIDALLTHYFPKEDQWERGVIRNCSITRLLLGLQEAKLLDFNDCLHL